MLEEIKITKDPVNLIKYICLTEQLRFMMNYDLPPFRPPSEADSYLIRVVRGCDWNRCKFCRMYKPIKFQIREKEEILRDIDNIPKIFPKSSSAFLGDSNPLVHPQICEIISYLKNKYPEIKRITAYARAKSFAKMSDDELEMLRDAGLNRVHIGLESGNDEVLKLVSKGVSSEELVKAGKKAVKYFELTYYVIIGLGGVERSKKHITDTAKVINSVKPTFVRIRSLTVFPTTPLKTLIGKAITPLSANQQLDELKMLIEKINVPTYLTCDHIFNYIFTTHGVIFYGVHGYLPDEKDRMIEEIESTKELIQALEKSGVPVYTYNQMCKMGLMLI